MRRWRRVRFRPRHSMTLELADTDALVEELAKRFESIICVGMKAPIDTSHPDQRTMMWRYKGNKFMCLGAASNLVHLLNTEIEAEIEPLPPGGL